MMDMNAGANIKWTKYNIDLTIFNSNVSNVTNRFIYLYL